MTQGIEKSKKKGLKPAKARRLPKRSRELTSGPLSAGGMTKNNRNKLIEEYKGFVEQIVGKLMQTMRLPADNRPEFVAAGYLGLVEAAERFDPEKGIDFKQYAFLRVRGEIIDAVRKTCQVTGRGYKMLQALEAANESGLDSLASKGKAKKTKSQKVGHIIDYLASSAMSYRLADLGCSTGQDQVDGDTPEEQVIRKDESERLKRLIAKLPEQERSIIEKYYFAGKRFIEITREEEGLSKSWASRLHSRAIQKLKEMYEAEEIA